MKKLFNGTGTTVGINPANKNDRAGATRNIKGALTMKKFVSMMAVILALVCALSLAPAALADDAATYVMAVNGVETSFGTVEDIVNVLTVAVERGATGEILITRTADNATIEAASPAEALVALNADAWNVPVSTEWNIGLTDQYGFSWQAPWKLDLATAPATAWTGFFQNVEPDPQFSSLDNGLTIQTDGYGVQYVDAYVEVGQVLKVSGSYVEVWLNGTLIVTTMDGGDPSRNTLLFVEIPASGTMTLRFSKGWVPSVQLFAAGYRPYATAEYRDLTIQLVNDVPHLGRPYDAIDIRWFDGTTTYDGVVSNDNNVIVVRQVADLAVVTID